MNLLREMQCASTIMLWQDSSLLTPDAVQAWQTAGRRWASKLLMWDKQPWESLLVFNLTKEFHPCFDQPCNGVVPFSSSTTARKTLLTAMRSQKNHLTNSHQVYFTHQPQRSIGTQTSLCRIRLLQQEEAQTRQTCFLLPQGKSHCPTTHLY